MEQAAIGLLEHGPEDWFGKITAIAVDGLKRVYVADKYAHNVRVFDSDGHYVRSLGRDGRGPGEFSWPIGFAWQNDSALWVRDWALNRYSVYDTSGAHIRDHRMFPLGGSIPWPARFDGGYLIEEWISRGRYRLVAMDPSAPFRPPQDTFLYPLAGVPLDQWNPSVYVESGSSVWRRKVPFTEGFEWSLDGSGGVWIGDTREYRFVQRSLVGDTLKVISHPIKGAPVSKDERRAAIEELGSDASELDQSRIPDRKPVFRLIIPSKSGGVWLVREGKGTSWLIDILDADGWIVGTGELPVEPDLEVFPVVMGNDVWIVTRGALNVPFVVRYSVQ